MRNFTQRIFAPAVLLLTLIQGSCTPGSCFEETNAFVKATFYNYATSVKASPDSLSMWGCGRDTSLIYKKSRINPALIPLDASTGQCCLVLRINGVNDTVSFTYTTTVHMISKECGYTFYHTIDDPVFTKNTIDTITVTKTSITTFSEENIRIYY
ncbi:MAG: DUF6452 family protein [Bacteroidales bacterium]|jgi:hypothetical protein|nr:DUF6452 family protein [Bacteroidales bacterium]